MHFYTVHPLYTQARNGSFVKIFTFITSHGRDRLRTIAITKFYPNDGKLFQKKKAEEKEE